MSGWGLEFLSWFKRSPGVGNGGTGGLRRARTPIHLRLGHCPQCQQSLGTTLCFALLLDSFQLREDACRLGKARSGWRGRRMGKNLLGFISAAPREQLLSQTQPESRGFHHPHL